MDPDKQCHCCHHACARVSSHFLTWVSMSGRRLCDIHTHVPLGSECDSGPGPGPWGSNAAWRVRVGRLQAQPARRRGGSRNPEWGLGEAPGCRAVRWGPRAAQPGVLEAARARVCRGVCWAVGGRQRRCPCRGLGAGRVCGRRLWQTLEAVSRLCLSAPEERVPPSLIPPWPRLQLGGWGWGPLWQRRRVDEARDP